MHETGLDLACSIHSSHAALINTQAIILNFLHTVYDVTNLASFEKLEYWYNEIKLYTDPDVPVVLVGNKTDVSCASLNT